MKNIARFILNILPAFLIVFGVAIAARAIRHADAKYVPSKTTLQMVADIKDSQEFAREFGPKVEAARNRANTYRETICRTEPGACTKEFLDPLNSSVDLSAFLAPAAR